MTESKIFDAVIIGGSFAGLSAALCLGRALREVMLIDNGDPCNRPSPHAQNFLTRDGQNPLVILKQARADVKKYKTVHFLKDTAEKAQKGDGIFEVETASGHNVKGRKLIFATGLTDLMPDIPGFSECWGQSILHCAYCHGYEVRGQKTGLLVNGAAYDMAKLLSRLTKNLTIFTDGQAVFSKEELAQLKSHGIVICDKSIKSLAHENGQITDVVFADGSREPIEVLYAHPHTQQKCNLAAYLGCRANDHDCVETDVFQRTNIEGVYAIGDCATLGRSIAVAVAAGTVAGMFLNKEMTEAEF